MLMLAELSLTAAQGEQFRAQLEKFIEEFDVEKSQDGGQRYRLLLAGYRSPTGLEPDA
jgi:hypothetical protein